MNPVDRAVEALKEAQTGGDPSKWGFLSAESCVRIVLDAIGEEVLVERLEMLAKGVEEIARSIAQRTLDEYERGWGSDGFSSYREGS